jgi:hypothetical protein
MIKANLKYLSSDKAKKIPESIITKGNRRPASKSSILLVIKPITTPINILTAGYLVNTDLNNFFQKCKISKIS